MSPNSVQFNTDNEFRKLEQPYVLSESDDKSPFIDQINNLKTFVVWRTDLLMDYQLFEDHLKKAIPFKIESKQFQTQYHALSWVCSQQLKRKDLTDEYKKYLIGKTYEYELNLLKQNFVEFSSESNFKVIGSSPSKYAIAKSIGDPLQIAAETVLKYGVYSKAIDKIMAIEKQMADMILMDHVRISHKNIVMLSEQTEQKIKELANNILANGINHIVYSAFEDHAESPIPECPQTANCLVDEEPLIRKMPEYDPDAEISSLTLTIPSWVSSMERANSHTNYQKTSSSARIKLIKQLAILERTIYIIQKTIEEVK